MASIGSLNEWARFLDAKSDDEAAAAAGGHAARLESVYEELCACIVPLWDVPTGQVAEDLMVARSAVIEAISVLESVRAGFDSGEREIA